MTERTAGWPEMVAGLIDLLRPVLAPFDVRLAAARLQVKVIEHEFAGPTRAAAFGGDTVILDPRLGPRAAAHSFAHEAAHVMLQRNLYSVPHSHEELFADWLGRELCLPRDWLAGEVHAPTVARRYEVSQATVAVQLAALGRAPTVQRFSGAVLCATCGPLEHAPACPCDAWRRVSPSARRALPDVREHPAWTQAPPSTIVQPPLELHSQRPLGLSR
jgi:hypothetical protein